MLKIYHNRSIAAQQRQGKKFYHGYKSCWETGGNWRHSFHFQSWKSSHFGEKKNPIICEGTTTEILIHWASTENKRVKRTRFNDQSSMCINWKTSTTIFRNFKTYSWEHCLLSSGWVFMALWWLIIAKKHLWWTFLNKKNYKRNGKNLGSDKNSANTNERIENSAWIPKGFFQKTIRRSIKVFLVAVGNWIKIKRAQINKKYNKETKVEFKG